MSSNEYEQRFGAIQRVYGAQGAAIIETLHVCVIGIGGVGSWSVEALARSGVGKITFIDHDSICASNTNRQIHSLSETIGRKKAQVMQERVLQINPHCQCEPIEDYLTDQTYIEYLSRGYDYVIDAIDSIKFKSIAIAYCTRNKIPIITIGGAGGLSDPSAITVSDLSRTTNDPLAATVRSALRRHHGFSKNLKRRFGVECVFSTEQPVYPKADGSVSHEKPGVHGISLDCRLGYGSISTVTAVFGFVAAARVINRSLQRKRRAPNKP